MKDTKGQLKNILEQWQLLIEKRNCQYSELPKVIETVAQKLNQVNPIISVYGAYNAGKSTLLNALFGSEMAKCGDSPETFKLEEYKWGEWTIYDTPGIDAPIEHQELTDDHIRKSECVLFVFSSDGDLESESIYRRIVELGKRNKPILLVINDKARVMSSDDPSASAEVIARINENLDSCWSKAGLSPEKKPKKVFVNAASALKGKLENKQLLISSSNIKELEKELESFLREKGEGDIFNGIVDFLTPHVDYLIEEIIKEKGSKQLQSLKITQKELGHKRNKLRLELDKVFRTELNTLRVKLNSAGNELTEDDFKAAIQSTIESVEEKVRNYIEPELERLAEDFEKDIRTSMNLNAVQVTNASLPEQEGLAVPQGDSGIKSQLTEVLNKAGGVEKVTVKVTENILLKLRVWKCPGLKGRWGTTLAKWAGKTGKVVATCLPAVIAAYEWYQAHKQQNEYEQQLVAQAEAMNMAINNSIAELESGFTSSSEAILQECFEPFESSINELIKVATEGSSSVNEDEEKANKLLKQLRMV